MPELGSTADATLGEPGFAKPKELVHRVDVRVRHWVNAIAMLAVIGLEICGR